MLPAGFSIQGLPLTGFRFEGARKNVPRVNRFWATRPLLGEQSIDILSSTPQTSQAYIRKTKEMLARVPAFLFDFLGRFQQRILLTPMVEDFLPYYKMSKEYDRVRKSKQPTSVGACYSESVNTILLSQYARSWEIENEQPTYTLSDQSDAPINARIHQFVHEAGHAVQSIFEVHGEALGLTKSSFQKEQAQAFAQDKALFRTKPHPYLYAMTNPDEAFAEVFAGCVNDRPTENETPNLSELTQARQYLPNMYRFVITSVLPRILSKPSRKKTEQ